MFDAIDFLETLYNDKKEYFYSQSEVTDFRAGYLRGLHEAILQLRNQEENKNEHY